MTDPQPSPISDAHVARLMLLFRGVEFYGSEVVECQNAHLRYLISQSIPLSTQSRVPLESSMFWDTPVLFEDSSLCRILWPHSSKVFKLWELMIAGESILFLAADVDIVSAAVLGTASLISPLRFEGLLRPYLTVSNCEAELLLSRSSPQIPSLLGVTNPLFVKKYSHWSNVLCFGSKCDRPRAPESGQYPISRGNTSVLTVSDSARVMMQFRLSDSMFSKRSFSVKESRLMPHASGDEGGLRTALRKLTSAFLLPLHTYLIGVLRTQRPFFLRGDWQHGLLGSNVVFGWLEKTAQLPLQYFNSRVELLNLYHAFLQTPSYLRSLYDAVEREVLISSSSLEEVLLLDPCPQGRSQVLHHLQTLLQRALAAPLCDADFVYSLQRLLAPACRLRDALAAQCADLIN